MIKTIKILGLGLILIILSCEQSSSNEDNDLAIMADLPSIKLSRLVPDSNGSNASTVADVTDSGSSNITKKGVCWSENMVPTIDDSFTLDGSGAGEFNSNISGLDPNTTYYVRAYATNSSGTAYSKEEQFFSQKIFDGDVFLTSQDEVNDFGSQQYSLVQGNITIGKEEGSDISSLAALKDLIEINGDFNIGSYEVSNPLLEDLKGLESLLKISTQFLNAIVSPDLNILSNEKLENLDALNLTDLRGRISISDNQSLKNINGLSKIKSIESLFVSNNAELTNLDGLSGVTIQSSVSIIANPKLTILDNLNVRDELIGVIIRNNENLIDISFLSNVTKFETDFWLIDNPILSDLSSLSNLESIGRRFHLIGLGITNLDALSNITEVAKNFTPLSEFGLAGLEISENLNLTNFCGVQQIFPLDIEGRIVIKENLFNPTKEDLANGNCQN